MNYLRGIKIGSLTFLSLQWYPEMRHFSLRAQLVLVGTMTDLRPPHSQTTGQSNVVATPGSHDTISYDEGRKLAEELHASYVECSARCDRRSVDHVLKTMIWRWHEFGQQKESHRGFGGCTLQ